MTRRCDYCLEHKEMTKVEPEGSIICKDCVDRELNAGRFIDRRQLQ